MIRKLHKYYEDFLDKNSPPNVKGDFFINKNYINESHISPNKRKYNSKGNVINEEVFNEELIQGLPINKKVKFDINLIIKSIQNGLVLLINYSGDKDNWKGGRERVIYPMVIGVNRNTGNILIRGWHLTGWSVSKRRNIKKEWRLFKASNIKSIQFTGDFYRLSPKGYKMNDRAMTEKLIKSADFNEIRRNQDALIKSGSIENMSDQTIGKEESSIITNIDARTTDTILNLKNIFDNEYVKNYKNKLDDLKMTFLKSLNKNEYISIIGALGTVNKTVKVYDNKYLVGIYKVKKSIKGKDILKIKNFDNKIEIPLYTFNGIK